MRQSWFDLCIIHKRSHDTAFRMVRDMMGWDDESLKAFMSSGDSIGRRGEKRIVSVAHEDTENEQKTEVGPTE